MHLENLTVDADGPVATVTLIQKQRSQLRAAGHAELGEDRLDMVASVCLEMHRCHAMSAVGRQVRGA